MEKQFTTGASLEDIEKQKVIREANFINNKNRLIFVAKDGWPVEGFIGKPVKTFIRRLFLTRKIKRYKNWLKDGGCEIAFN